MNILTIFSPVLASDSGLLYAFSHSDFLGQLICIVLFIFSIFTWIVMINKYCSMRKLEEANNQFLKAFREKPSPLSLNESSKLAYCPLAAVYLGAKKRIEAFHLVDKGTNTRRALSDAELEIVKSNVEQTIEDQLVKLDKSMIFLQTAVSASPFLGLFGTVWGITIAFTNLASKGKADISTLAPGVSGALLTTVIALIVAIPSLVGYNIITASIRKMTVQLDNFAEEFHSRLKIEQMDSIAAASNEQQY